MERLKDFGSFAWFEFFRKNLAKTLKLNSSFDFSEVYEVFVICFKESEVLKSYEIENFGQ